MNIYVKGQFVKWESQSNGTTKTKQGEIFAVVPKTKSARAYLPSGLARSQVKFDTVYASMDRYIVAVPRGGKSSKVDYYCPRPSLLELVEVETG